MLTDTYKYIRRRIRRRFFELLGSYKYSRPSLNNLDEKLSKYFNYKGGFFIEAGANDGYQQSNTYFLERVLGWKGVLVEGIPELYKRCKSERKAKSFNAALVSHDFKEDYVQMHYADLMTVVDGALKDENKEKQHVSTGCKAKGAEGYSIQVPARTLDSILDEAQPPQTIDLFSLDVEGYELQVLQGLSFEKYKPKYILVEANFFDEVNDYLSPHYDMIEKLSHHDYLYRRKGL